MGEKIFDWIDIIFTLLVRLSIVYFGIALLISLFFWPLTGKGWMMAFKISLLWPIGALCLQPHKAIPHYVEMLGLDKIMAEISDSVDSKRNK